MTTLKLSSQERRRLKALAIHTTDADVLRRVQTLLWLASGHDVEDIAQRLCVCRRTIYYWAEQYGSRADDDIIGRLSSTSERRPRTRSASLIRSLTNHRY